ncbi:tumor necrosis factor receptor superfamily member wengen isoform X1 [Diprion similis]|uniref:tumor necrosis factor receptor superfamily member wengen isoform X1 n=1 Tax=Diprion similis TaxID=362088 RepID=UPI001EF860F9|nr:tumor necrosis factor receptor superfamily member wengen isoform X1 [Diprion similis]
MARADIALHHYKPQVMLGGGASGLLAVTLALFGSFPGALKTEISGEPICQPGLGFWEPKTGRCLPCTKCAPEFTLRPCAVHQDTVCGPLSALQLDWSWLATRKGQETSQPRTVAAARSKMIWTFPDVAAGQDDSGGRSPMPFRSPRGNVDDEVTVDEDARIGDDKENTGFDPRDEESERRIHSPQERRKVRDQADIPWDWQTGALVLAVCACVIFFLVAGCSALVYARQWRRMKRNFEPAGLEEISARLNLMVKAELAELTAGAPMSPGDPETRCQYLEKLLDRKRETPVVAGWHEHVEDGGGRGNLYIEETPGGPGGREPGRPASTPRTRRAQIAQIHRNIESILSHKANRS